jgi:hypothetical protein
VFVDWRGDTSFKPIAKARQAEARARLGALEILWRKDLMVIKWTTRAPGTPGGPGPRGLSAGHAGPGQAHQPQPTPRGALPCGALSRHRFKFEE